MAKQWTGTCSACNRTISYADTLALRDAAVGRPRQLLCANCERLERRGLKPVSVPNVMLAGIPESGAAPLGRLTTKEHVHLLEERLPNFDRDDFKVQDSEIAALYGELMRDDTPVVIAVAPTGSGKSTFLTYRLACPQGVPLDTFTRGRQIVITQPRVKAAVSIPKFVAERLHGADWGIGNEIGYRVRGQHACDWRNRLTYVTDGTLINWLVRGELDRISLIIIDEAHERSLNIDVILGLVTRALPQFPHLKMLIVSATIDHAHFQRHFERRLPKGLRCGIVVCSGAKPKGLVVHYKADSIGRLPYAQGPLKELSRTVASDVAQAILRLLLAMDGPPKFRNPNIEPGDILGFLHGKREINDACERIETYLANEYPELRANTDIYPYHAEVAADTAKMATEKKEDPSRRRVVIASNAAETSLTIEGLVHVVDSGFIKQTQWDPVLEQAPLLPVAHSQAGCRQRWGRAGRVMPGSAWCLYSKSQFGTVFSTATVPEIQRSCLDAVLLKAKRGGADRVDQKSFPWLDAPAADEIERTLARLRRQHLIDAEGDLTDAGVLAAMANEEDTLYNLLITDGDRFGFGVEVSTLVPFLELGLDNLFPYDKEWDDDTKRGVREAQKRIRTTCSDDLELCLRIYSEWQNAGLPAYAQWKPPRPDRQEAAHCNVSPSKLMEELNSAHDVRTIAETIRKHVANTAIEKRYADRALLAFRSAARTLWPRMHGIDLDVLESVAKRRASLIEEIGAKKKGMEDRAIDFAGLDRLRAIIARAFIDQMHVRDDSDARGIAGAPRYRPLFPTSDDKTPVEIKTVSNCSLNPPAAFVALGPKESLPAKGDRESIRLVPFAVRISLETMEAVRGRDDLELAEYLRQTLPRPAQGSAEDARLLQHERLRKEYPVGTIVECQMLGDARAITDVEVIRVVGWGGGPPLKFSSSETWQELREYERNKSFDAGEWDSPKTQGYRGQVIRAEEEADLISEEMQPPEALEQLRERPQPPESTTVSGRLQWFGATRVGHTVRAEVTRHSDITADPSLILVAPPLRERFTEFVKITGIGDEIETEVIGPTPRGSLERGLQLRDPRTGLELVLPTDEVVLLREECLLDDLEPGSHLRARVEFVEQRTRTVHVTALNALEIDLARLHTMVGTETLQGVIRHIEQDERNVYMVATIEGRTTSVLRVPIKIVIPRQRFDGPRGFSIPYTVGRKIALRTRTDASSNVDNDARLTDEDKSALAAVGIRAEGGSLWCKGRLTFQARTAALRAARSLELMSAVRALFTRSNLLFGEPVFPDLVGKTVEGRVQSFKSYRMEVVLPGAIIGILDHTEASWFDRSPRLDQIFKVGQIIRAVVMSFNDKGHAVLSTKRARLSQDPWSGNGIATLYPVGTRLVCKIASAIADRAWVDIEPGLQGSAHVKELRALAGGGFIADVRKVASAGRWVSISVRAHDIARKQLGVQILGWATPPPDEAIVASQSQTASPAVTPTAEPPVSWIDGDWPWDAGENAIPKEVLPPKSPPPRRPRPRPPIEQRSNPSKWRILL